MIAVFQKDIDKSCKLSYECLDFYDNLLCFFIPRVLRLFRCALLDREIGQCVELD